MTTAMVPEQLQPHAAFLRRLEHYFGVSGVRYKATSGTPDIASVPATGLILLGPRWERSTPDLQRSKLTHEFLHLIGYPHLPKHHYFSNPRRDRLSPVVYRDILAGTPQFSPARFGLEEPPMTPRTANPSSRSRRRNPVPHLWEAVVGGVAAGAGLAAGNRLAGAALDRAAAWTQPVATPTPQGGNTVVRNPARRRSARNGDAFEDWQASHQYNPVLDVGASVEIPRLDATGVITQVEKGGLFSGPTRYRVRFVRRDGKDDQAWFTDKAVRVLNPYQEGEEVRVRSLMPSFRINSVKTKRGKGLFGRTTRTYEVMATYPGMGTKSVTVPEKEIRRRNPSASAAANVAACQQCDNPIRVRATARTVTCRECGARHAVNR